MLNEEDGEDQLDYIFTVDIFNEGVDIPEINDFIGNYMNNFMIPIALSGDRSYNKDAMRRYIREGVRVIPGSSTIHFNNIGRTKLTVDLSLEWEETENSDLFQYDVHLTTPKDTDYRKYHSEAFFQNGEKNGDEATLHNSRATVTLAFFN